MGINIRTVVYVISDMSAKLSSSNVAIINELTELHFEDIENVTYQMLIDARKDSLGMAYGYPMYKDGIEFWVLPSVPMGIVVDPNSDVIKEYTEEHYKKYVLPTWDITEDANPKDAE